ncbi:carbohydrate esterase family 4 protein [Laccaria amethystina LaAM-08-1]|uniref:chitin deacetylase n=1 Tax=Laccaria amethystina LaAM-08-1 TaxID=1095629 RepID=A0A0C9YEM9_9AGAR|nr:carbohydrate esterase family 4 protein [Laccaria amethystina LaAM-08-1]
MRIQALTLLSALALVNAQKLNNRHLNVAHRRQATSASSSASAPAATSPPVVSSAPPPPATSSTPTSASLPAAAPPASISAPVGSTSSGSASASSVTTTTSTGPPPLATGTDIPALANITLGMPTHAPLPPATTYPVGATPPVSGAPVLPTTFVFRSGDWPVQDKVPDTSSSQVAEWMKELDGFNIPNINPTADGSCLGDPAAAADAQNRGWWTCGGWTRSTDITSCPDKLTWGVSFDDGPSFYTQNLLNYLDQKDITATFFVVGSRVIERPTVLIEEYMAGHEISVHTWSHRPLTSLTTPQIVAELGWTRKAIKNVLGVAPTTMRPPYGDIDDRVRAISLAMGMIPIMWTRTPSGGVFDTNDWRVAGGQVNGTDSFNTFNTILTNATTMNNGFIVLQHDLFEITVDLAIGYTLNAALTHNPPFNLLPIGECSKIPTSNLYLESNKNTSFPVINQTTGGIDIDGNGTPDTKSGASSSSNSAFGNQVPLLFALMLAGSALIFGLF